MKKEDKFFNLLVELTSDESREISNAYLAKVEKALSLYTEMFLKPKLQGKDKLTKITIDKKPRGVDVFDDTTPFALGGTDPVTGGISIHAGLLKDIDPRNPGFFEKRNEILMRFFTTAAHEVRHSFQVAYRKALVGNGKNSQEKLKLYEDILGPDAYEIAAGTVDRFTNEQLELYINFYKVIRPENYEKAKNVLEVAKKSNVPYWASLHEIDAREAEMEDTQELLEFLTDKMTTSFDAYRFPERFEELTDIFSGALTCEPKRKKRKDDDLFGELIDGLNDFEKAAKNLATAQKKAKGKRKGLEEDFVDLTDQFLKQQNVFMPTIETVSQLLSNEIIIQSEYTQTLDVIVRSMKSIGAADLVTYAKAIENQPHKEVAFAKMLGDLVQIKHTRGLVEDEQKMKEAAQLLEEAGLDWASGVVDLHIDMFIGGENGI